MNAKLVLQDGTVFEGKSVGATGSAIGNVIFNTAMSGYQEIMTDPASAGHLVAFSYPLIGNYGFNSEDVESIRPQLAGLIVNEMSDESFHHASELIGDEYLKQNNVVGIEDIDVRALVRYIRDNGSMLGIITTEHTVDEAKAALEKAPTYESVNYVEKVSTTEPYQWVGHKNVPPSEEKGNDAAARVVVIDYGVKFNILRGLAKRGIDVIVLPHNATLQDIEQWNPGGVLLSSGPGDPNNLNAEIEVIKQLIDAHPDLPIFGISLGSLLLGRAFGATVSPLKFGHHGDQAVKSTSTGKVTTTYQYEDYVLNANSFPDGIEVAYSNLNDGTVNGIKHKSKHISGVQFHPESGPGPLDDDSILDQFAEEVKKAAASQKVA